MARFEKIPYQHWERARTMRNRPTSAERALWYALRNRQLGVRFLRQHTIGPYIADFFCYECKLVIEIDGGCHRLPELAEHDRNRDSYFRAQQITVKRFTNADVLMELERVIDTIRNEIYPNVL